MILPQLPHSSRTEEIQASFSSAGSPTSRARAWLTGSSSQKTHRRQRGGKSSRLSSVMLASRRDTSYLCGSTPTYGTQPLAALIIGPPTYRTPQPDVRIQTPVSMARSSPWFRQCLAASHGAAREVAARACRPELPPGSPLRHWDWRHADDWTGRAGRARDCRSLDCFAAWLIAAASRSTSASDVSNAVIHRTMQRPSSDSDQIWQLQSC